MTRTAVTVSEVGRYWHFLARTRVQIPPQSEPKIPLACSPVVRVCRTIHLYQRSGTDVDVIDSCRKNCSRAVSLAGNSCGAHEVLEVAKIPKWQGVITVNMHPIVAGPQRVLLLDEHCQNSQVVFKCLLTHRCTFLKLQLGKKYKNGFLHFVFYIFIVIIFSQQFSSLGAL